MVYRYRADTPASPLASTDAGLKVANFFGYFVLFFLVALIVVGIVGAYYYKELDKPTGVKIALIKDTSLVKPVYPNPDPDKPDQKAWYYIPYSVTWNPSKFNSGYMVYVGTSIPLGESSQVIALRKKEDVSEGTTYTAMVPINTASQPDFIYAGVSSNYSLLGGLYNVQSGISVQTNDSKTPYANVVN